MHNLDGGFLRWWPKYAENGDLYFIPTEHVRTLIVSEEIRNAVSPRVSPARTGEIYFPENLGFMPVRGGTNNAIRARGVRFKCKELVAIVGEEFLARCGFSRATKKSTEPRLTKLRELAPDNFLGTGLRILRITADDAGVLDDSTIGEDNIATSMMSAAAEFDGGRKFVLAFREFEASLERLWIHSAGDTVMLPHLPGGAQNVQFLAASDDAQVIAFARTPWFDLGISEELQPLVQEGLL